MQNWIPCLGLSHRLPLITSVYLSTSRLSEQSVESLYTANYPTIPAFRLGMDTLGLSPRVPPGRQHTGFLVASRPLLLGEGDRKLPAQRGSAESKPVIGDYRKHCRLLNEDPRSKSGTFSTKSVGGDLDKIGLLSQRVAGATRAPKQTGVMPSLSIYSNHRIFAGCSPILLAECLQPCLSPSTGAGYNLHCSD
ncbi:hypothetical protein BO78DRAFT_73762 [Aspergillus sclerotiicarbonarius CBS 121057]|uniref:Uncharacterized protein n=1 Tax=Aspergillus sclerotiicarbonarius (strain CBS 121057 / IBT 28362) TaxID=1448318 RepID=A0A319EG79_ASPSB|nr:hypothetical protein BO78DRAFT_73762 [Aspergillus sclerotiicarbonarius CBS 121057]